MARDKTSDRQWYGKFLKASGENPDIRTLKQYFEKNYIIKGAKNKEGATAKGKENKVANSSIIQDIWKAIHSAAELANDQQSSMLSAVFLDITLVQLSQTQNSLSPQPNEPNEVTKPKLSNNYSW